MSRPLPRYQPDTTAADHIKIERITRNANPTHISLKYASPTELRGIPVQARGIGGTSPNTNPLTETIRRNTQRPTH